MTDKELLAILTAILLVGKSVSGDDQISQALAFARVILEKSK